jgi:hypothetical protein
MSHQLTDLRSESIAAERVRVDIGFTVRESFYYGPDYNFTPQQWLELRDALYQPAIPKSGSLVLSTDIVGKERELCAHYKDVIDKATAHGKSLQSSSHFWNKPVIYSPDLFNLSFAWHDRFREGKGFLDALLHGAEGDVYSDLDQGWQLDIQLFNGILYVQEVDPDEGTCHCNVNFEYAPFRAQVVELMPRVQHLIAYLTSELGRDYWT